MINDRYTGAAEQTTVSTFGLNGSVFRLDPLLWEFYSGIRKKSRSRIIDCNDILLTDIGEISSSLLGLTHVVDVTSADPKEFFFQSYGYKAGIAFGENFDKKKIGEITSPSFRQFVIDSYNQVKTSGASWVSDVLTEQARFQSRYCRLMVPLSNNGGNVSHVLVAIHRHSLNVH